MIGLEKAKKICADLHNIGKRLDSEAIYKIVEEAEQRLNYPSKLRVAFIANQFRGAALALKDGFGIKALPEEIKPLQVVSSAKIIYEKQDVESHEPVYQLKNRSEQPYTLKVGRKEELLEHIDAQILYSQNEYEDFEWKKELAEIDYAFLVISAIQMLSVSERKMIEEVIMKHFGLSRFSIILTDTEMIHSLDGYNEVKSRIEWYLKSIGADGKYYELGTETLGAFISDRLNKEKDELRNLSAYMTARLCFEDVKGELQQMKEQASINMEELESSLNILKKREGTMKNKGALAGSRVRNELKGNIYYNISSAHQKLYTQMYEEIDKAINSSKNIKKTQKEIQNYVESTVEKFMYNLGRGFEKDMLKLSEELDKQMRQDAGEYFSDTYYFKFIEFSPGPVRVGIKDGFTVHPEFVIAESEQIVKTKKFSKIMLYFSLPFFLQGKLFRAFGAAAGSWALKKKAKEESEAVSIELLKKAVKEECMEMQLNQIAAIKAKIYQMADEAEQEILKAYEVFIGAVMTEMCDLKEKVKLANSKKEILDQIFEKELILIESELELK